MPDLLSVNKEAEQIIHGARRNDYGTPLQNHSLTALLWHGYIQQRCKQPDFVMGPEDVCLLNILQKIARMATTGKVTRDGLVDIAGYAGNVELIQNDPTRR